MKNIGIIAKDIPKARRAASQVARWLSIRGRKVYIDSTTAAALKVRGYERSRIPQLADLIIVLGGDGTLLSAARVVAGSKRNVPLFGVNLGTLGFMAEVSLEELYESLEKAIAGRLRAEERMMLSATIIRGGRRLSEYTALNDAVVNKGTLARMVLLDVSVGDDHLTSIRADGLILATTTGSTAYSLSAGGPIIHPTIHCLVLTPICPHTLTNRPIVIPDSSLVRIKLLSQSEGVSLSLDGQVMEQIIRGDIVEIRKAKYRVKMIKHPTKDYYEILRTKLKWGR
ncbi:MAG TPA: NAD(+)/NADH kinase [Nitrospirota bacterium]|nr:NAD(+)/NADH kinase [Nitrospirota bacterium]